MTLYDEYKQMQIDFSLLGLAPGDSRSGYFCTPQGAEVIGWAGVDGIHYCFVPGFGDMVFAVNPSSEPGNFVHPLARSFRDFLRLLLACGLAAAEQVWQWNRGEFEAFRETYPPEPEQRAVLDNLGAELVLTPMADPFGYIKELQSTFDYGQIPYSEEYYELLPEEPPTNIPPEPSEWRVYFEQGLNSYHIGRDKPGQELPVGKSFVWGDSLWHIPAVYVCSKGLVVDFCGEISPARLRAFGKKWQPLIAPGRELTPEEQERMNAEDPMNISFRPELTVNGRKMPGWSGSGSGWRPLAYQEEYSPQDWENLRLLEHYGLDPAQGWFLWRCSFPWATKRRPVLQSISLKLIEEPLPVPGCRFTVAGAGDRVPFIHPVTGAAHTLRVLDYKEEQVDTVGLGEDWDYPTHCMAMYYTVEPALPRQELTVRDCNRGDSPRPRPDTGGGADGPGAVCSIGIIGGGDGPVAIFLGYASAACSSLYFRLPAQIQWQLVFYPKTVADMEVNLLLS